MKGYITVYVLDYELSVKGVFNSYVEALTRICEIEWEWYNAFPQNYSEDLIQEYGTTDITRDMFDKMTVKMYENGDLEWGITSTEYWF